MVLPPRSRDVPPPEPIAVDPRPSPRYAPQQGAAVARPREAFAIVTVFLLVANVGILGLMVSTGVDAMSPSVDDVVRWGANYGPATLRGDWWRLITSVFVHGGVIHLAFNMYVLWDLGRLVERIFGSLGFALVYIVAGIGGSFTSVAMDPQVASVGASGAIFGLAGAFLAFLALNRGRMDPRIAQHLRRTLLTFVIVNLVIGWRIPGIDQAAHVGGLATGFLAGLAGAPSIQPGGPVRPYARYPLVAALGIALCVATYAGLPLRLH